MQFFQKQIQLPPFRRGCHLVTNYIVDAIPEIRDLSCGLLNCFLQHTSASLTINENADPDVRKDLDMALDEIAPEDWDYVHTAEGPDDMPAHVKSSLLGCSLVIPITSGRLNLGTWQGIYLCEHRNHPTRRSVVITASGISEVRTPNDH
jgi:secondary thiamine-phosphate synthase enzyme